MKKNVQLLLRRNASIFACSLVVTLFTHSFAYSHSSKQVNSHEPIIVENPTSAKNTVELFLHQKLTSPALGYPMTDHTTWTLSGLGTSQSGTGGSLFEVQLSTPGDYTLSLHTHESHGSCDHSSELEVTVRVLPFAIQLNLELLSLSQSLQAGQNNLTVSVPVVVHELAGAPFPFHELSIRGAGVNTTLSGKMARTKQADNGTVQRIDFSLSGSCESGTYLMLDIYFKERVIGTYYVPYKVN